MTARRPGRRFQFREPPSFERQAPHPGPLSRLVHAGAPDAPVAHINVVPDASRFMAGCALCEAQLPGSGLDGDPGCPACQVALELADEPPVAFA